MAGSTENVVSNNFPTSLPLPFPPFLPKIFQQTLLQCQIHFVIRNVFGTVFHDFLKHWCQHFIYSSKLKLHVKCKQLQFKTPWKARPNKSKIYINHELISQVKSLRNNWNWNAIHHIFQSNQHTGLANLQYKYSKKRKHMHVHMH